MGGVGLGGWLLPESTGTPPLRSAVSFRSGGVAADRDRDCRSRRGGACDVRADSLRNEYRYLPPDRRFHCRDTTGIREPHAGGDRSLRCGDLARTWRRRQRAPYRGAFDVPLPVSLSALPAPA